jgi:hypothetical protein
VLGDKADLVHWVRRYAVAERRADAERREHPPSPDESLSRSLELMRLARDHRVTDVPDGEIAAEDLLAYSTWNRIRRRFSSADG